MAAAKKKPEAGKRLDLTFLSFVLILLTTGLVMLFSASYAYSYEYYGNSYKFITRQAAFAAAGVALMLIISKIDYHFWRRFAWIVYVLAIGMLAVLLALPPMVKISIVAEKCGSSTTSPQVRPKSTTRKNINLKLFISFELPAISEENSSIIANFATSDG